MPPPLKNCVPAFELAAEIVSRAARPRSVENDPERTQHGGG